MESRSLDWLWRRCRESGERTFMVSGPLRCTYSWLGQRVAFWRQRLAAEGAAAGSVLAIRGDHGPEAAALLLAAAEERLIVVPLAPGLEAGRCREALAAAHVQVLADLDPSALGRLERVASSGSHALLRRLAERGRAGLVLFTSGSTGAAKAVVHDLDGILERYRTPRRAYVTLAFLTFDHIGGLDTLLSVLAGGGTLVTAASRDPDAVCGLIARERVELLPASPTFLNLLLISEAWTRHDLSSLRRVSFSTEVMPQRVLDRLREALPHVSFHQMYGLSELGILRARSEASGSLWLELGGPGVETRVENGTLWVRSPTAMLGYLNAPAPLTPDGWYDTGDAVEVRNGRFRILGRRSEMINVGGEKVYPAEIENVLLEMPGVIDVTVRGEPNPITGHVVAGRFTLAAPAEASELRQRVRAFCRGRLAAFKVPARIEIAEGPQHSRRFKKGARIDAVPGLRGDGIL